MVVEARGARRPAAARWPLAAYTLAFGLLLPAVALAHDALEVAEGMIESAEFERALTRLDALADDERAGLGADEVARLLRLHAVASAALGRDEATRRDLRALASLLSGADPGALPTPLREVYEAEAGRSSRPVRVRVRLVHELGGQVQAAGAVEHDPGALVRAVVLRCIARDREIARARAEQLTVPASEGLRCAAAALGPGGYLVALDEVRWLGGGLDPETLDDPSWTFEGPPPRRARWKLALGVTTALAVVGGVVLAIVLASRPPALAGPTWEGS
ncbi:MAG: hypothetical protein KF901_13445 [Myxococcales bacterium]|nr:hypothetical protein [Myxococcales bacterium]